MQRLNFAHSVPGKRRNSRRHFFCTDVAGSFCIFVRCFATRYTAKTSVYKSFFFYVNVQLEMLALKFVFVPDNKILKDNLKC